MAEAELRKLHELIWRLWNDAERRSDTDRVGIAAFAIEAAIARVGGFCHMLGTAAVLRDGIECLTSRDVPVAGRARGAHPLCRPHGGLARSPYLLVADE